MLLFYVRHGLPIYNPDSLTPLGHRQAEAVAKRLALYGVDRVFASSSNRAQQTAQPTCELTGRTMEILDWCNENYAWKEMNCICKDGKTRWIFSQMAMADVLASPEVRALGEEWYRHPALSDPRFERDIKRIKRETFAFLRQFGLEYDPERNMYRYPQPGEERIALFAHQGFSMSFLSTVLGIPYPEFATHFDISHSGLTVVQFRAMENGYCIPRVLTHANDSHLYREGLPTRYQDELYF